VTSVDKVGLNALGGLGGGVERILAGGGGGHLLGAVVGAVAGRYQQFDSKNMERLKKSSEKAKIWRCECLWAPEREERKAKQQFRLKHGNR
jgi:uncharacterized protein YcfJ